MGWLGNFSALQLTLEKTTRTRVTYPATDVAHNIFVAAEVEINSMLGNASRNPATNFSILLSVTLVSLQPVSKRQHYPIKLLLSAHLTIVDATSCKKRCRMQHDSSNLSRIARFLSQNCHTSCTKHCQERHRLEAQIEGNMALHFTLQLIILLPTKSLVQYQVSCAKLLASLWKRGQFGLCPPLNDIREAQIWQCWQASVKFCCLR